MSRHTKDIIPAGYLEGDGDKQWELRLLDVAVLLLNVRRGALEPTVGFEDCRDTLESLCKKLGRKVYLPQTTFESALWSSNLLSEQDKFWHPEGITFNQWMKRMLGSYSFNKVFNLIEDKQDV